MNGNCDNDVAAVEAPIKIKIKLIRSIDLLLVIVVDLLTIFVAQSSKMLH
jgi:hypothetical protein